MPVGYRTGCEEDGGRSSWDGLTARPLAWSAWYPCREDLGGDRVEGQFFDLGDVRLNAELQDRTKFPVVLMSHGTGGSPEGMGWLARRLALAGHIVIGAHHHGNTAREGYRPEGFLCWWERAADLSVLLTRLSERGAFSGRLDMDRVSALGFSLGAHSVLAVAGAVTSMNRYRRWATEFGQFQGGPREMPDAAEHIPRLLRESEPFRLSWSRQSESFVDRRFRAVAALAPPPPVRGFDPASLRRIAIPVTLITGEADREAPSHECADWLQRCNPRFRRARLGEDVGHYTFLGLPAGKVRREEVYLFADSPGVNRDDVHVRTGDAVLSAIAG